MELVSTEREKKERGTIKVATEEDKDVFFTKNIRGLIKRTLKSVLLKERAVYAGLNRKQVCYGSKALK